MQVNSVRTFVRRTRELVLTFLALAFLAQIGGAVFAAWDKTKPANNSALVSSEIRANWTSLEAAFGNIDANPLQIASAMDALAAVRFTLAPTYKPGGDSGYDATLSGLLTASVDTTQRANSGTGLTDLSSYSLPAATLNTNARVLKCSAWGSFAANANVKTLTFTFGATSTQLTNGGINGGGWKIEAFITRTGAATQKMVAEGRTRNAGGDIILTTSSPTETLSGAITIKTKGQSGTASSDILQEVFWCEVVGV